jgi:signal transduction histidine kinase
MRYSAALLVSLSLSIGAFSNTTICSKARGSSDGTQYDFRLSVGACQDRGDCWMQFKAPEDVFIVEVDGVPLFDTRSGENYLGNESFLLPISESHPLRHVSVSANDLNQDKKFPRELCLRFGRHGDLRWQNGVQWFFLTGANLFSAYFLLMISFFLAFSLWFRRSSLAFSLLLYSLISCAYLMSFSEYPRAIIDPVFASGALHFSFRLLQDLGLVIVFNNFYQKADSKNVIRKISWVYAATITTYALMSFVGIADYVYFSRLIMIMAPLVAAPMAIGTWFALKAKDKFERKVLVPFSVFLLALQVNDLLVFWKLIDSYYTVRLYIPFIVGLTLFLYFRRMHVDLVSSNISTERHRIFKEFIHDVKSSLAVLKIFFAGHDDTKGRQQVIRAALENIERMVSQIDSTAKEVSAKVPLVRALATVVDQKRLEFPDFEISFDWVSEVYVFASPVKLQRVLSNIINNAYESYEDGRKFLEIKFAVGSDDVQVSFTDKGRGMSRALQSRLLNEEVSTKEAGQGIGLMSAFRYVTELGGELRIISREGFGSTVEVTLNSAPGEVEHSNNMDDQGGVPVVSSPPDFVLIDDDEYIRLSWEHYARDAKRIVRTYASVNSFIEASEDIKRDCPIYLDVNISGKRSLDYLEKIENIGFVNIILATGENISLDGLPKIVKGVSGKLPPIH